MERDVERGRERKRERVTMTFPLWCPKTVSHTFFVARLIYKNCWLKTSCSNVLRRCWRVSSNISQLLVISLCVRLVGWQPTVRCPLFSGSPCYARTHIRKFIRDFLKLRWVFNMMKCLAQSDTSLGDNQFTLCGRGHKKNEGENVMLHTVDVNCGVPATATVCWKHILMMMQPACLLWHYEYIYPARMVRCTQPIRTDTGATNDTRTMWSTTTTMMMLLLLLGNIRWFDAWWQFRNHRIRCFDDVRCSPICHSMWIHFDCVFSGSWIRLISCGMPHMWMTRAQRLILFQHFVQQQQQRINFQNSKWSKD